jgi:flagellar motor switch protein FliM
MDFEPGDVISFELPETVPLYVEGLPMFRGKFGVSRGNKAVKVVERIDLKHK